ncbi:MAG: SDR family NAD(P)-dependent oxidoreductase [Thermoguttaceae bacterium]
MTASQQHEPASDQKTAVVTGASAGNGAAFAGELARRRFNLVLVARRENRLKALADELSAGFGVSVETVCVDLADEVAVERLAEMIGNRHDIELLVNNAGFGVQGRFHEASIQKNLAMIRVHVVATVRLTHAVLPQMVARNRGAVVNVSSLASFFTAPGAVSYCATKAYLNSFSQSVQAELRNTAVRIQALCPGFTHTEFHDVPDAKMDRSLVPGFMWMPAERVVGISLDALKRNRVICVPGLVNRMLALVLRSHLFDGLTRRTFAKYLKRDLPAPPNAAIPDKPAAP